MNSDETTLPVESVKSEAEPNVESPPAPMSPPVPTGSTEFDFVGDNKADIGRWRTLVSTTEYSIMNSSGGPITPTQIGSQSAKLAPADFDSDGKTDLAVFDAGTWTIKKSSDGITQTINGFGQAGDIPVPGNYAGDAAIDAALYRPSNSTWYVREAVNGTVTSQTWGQTDDIPVAGNYDGDGVTDLAVFRPSSGVWYIIGSTDGNITRTWGLGATDTPVPADFDGDGKTDIAVFRKSTGIWYIFTSISGFTTWTTQSWGNYGDQPVPADYDGDGKADFAIWRPKTGTWWLVHSNNSSIHTYVLGVQGDKAVPSAYLKQVAGSVPVDDLAKARLSPRNATGGTNLYSQNFSWGSNLVSLPGRAGLDLSLGIGYNSLVWTKADNEIFFDTDNSNVSPGFRLGFPTIEPVYYDDDKSKFAYMMVTPSGSRIEFRQTAVSGVYETADSSYAVLTTTGAPNPNDPVANITITVTTTDGTQMKYEWKVGTFRCTQIKDRNGNYISAVYNVYGNLDYVTDTLGRTVTVGYDSELYPISIKQTWQSGEHSYALFSYTNLTINTNFSTSLTVIGPPNTTPIKVLEKITYADTSHTNFTYNSYGQVWKVENYADDDHLLNDVRTNLQTPASPEPDVPRLGWTKSYVQNFNSGNDVTVTNTLTPGQTYSVGGFSGTAARIDVTMSDHPTTGLYSRTFVGETGWKEGLPVATEDCIGTNCSDRKRWTWTDYTQDNTALSYILNPRVIESRVGDTVNVKKTAVTYRLYPSTTVAEYGLVSKVEVFDTGLSNVIKRVETDYNLATAYTDRRIIGLPLETRAWGKNDVTQNLEQVSRMTYVYDGEAFNLNLEPNQIPPLPSTTHNTANYSSTFVVGRGNLTSTTRHDVSGQTAAVTSKTRYDIAGSVVAKLDPLDRKVRIEYTDKFSDLLDRNSFAYPTKVYDPANNYSEIKYRYDIGANVWAKSPAPQGQSQGKITEREFDDKGRLLKDKIVNHGGAYTRYEYPTNGIQSKVFSTIIDTNNSTTGDTADEVMSESWADGAGRVRRSRTEHPGSIGGWSGSIAEYDILGRVKRSSVPTEISVPNVNDPDTWAPVGDDLTRGWLWTYQKYDWKGRVIRKINTDGIDQTTPNDSDVLITYEGCGCAGGQITTVEGEKISAYNGSYQIQDVGRRKQKVYEDITGRAFKTEVLNWDGTTYSTIKTLFNGRDQALEIKQYQGTDTSGTFQTTSTTYDGHGRMKTRHLPADSSGNNTVWVYNPDDSVQTVTDPRGAASSFTYNDPRGVLTGISYSVPQGSNIPVTPSVFFSNDAAGNRTSMTDGTGTVTYAYSQLSQITQETKMFEGVTGSFSIGYNYHLGGGLKSVFDPGDSARTITYGYNRSGSLTDIAGNTGYLVHTRKVRAFGGLKQEDYGSGFKLRQQFDTRLRVQEYDIQNSSLQSVSKVLYEYNNSDQVLRANGGGYFDRYYGYDHAGRMTGTHTKATGTTAYPAYNQAAGYDVWNNLATRTSQTWGFAINSSSNYQNNRNTQAESWDSYSGAVVTENWQYDASGNATNTGEQTHKFDAAGRKIESLEYTPTQQRIELLIQQTYDGDGRIVKRFEREIISGQPTQAVTDYSLFSTVLGGAVIAKVSALGVRGEDTIFEPAGRQIAKNGTTVKYQHEAPFTASSFETTSQTTNVEPREFEPFGGEIPTQPPLNNSPDWIPVGNYQQTGNPLDAQGGCLEDGLPADCSAMVQRVCVGNPRCMNRENRMGGLGYFLAGYYWKGSQRGWKVSYNTRNSGKVTQFYTMAETEKMIDNFEGGRIAAVFSWSSLSMHASVSGNANPNFIWSKIGEAPYVKRILDAAEFARDSKECAKAFEAIGATPIGEQMNNTTIVTQNVFSDSRDDAAWAPSADFAGQLRTALAKSTSWSRGVTTNDVTPVGEHSGRRFIGITNRGLKETDDWLEVTVVHSFIHSGGIGSQTWGEWFLWRRTNRTWGEWFGGKKPHDLRFLGAQYDEIIKHCTRKGESKLGKAEQ